MKPARAAAFFSGYSPARAVSAACRLDGGQEDNRLAKAQRALQQINSPSTSYQALVAAFAQSLAILQTFGTADTMMEVMEGAFVPELEDTRLLVQRIRYLCHESGEEERDNSCMLNC